MSAAAEAVEDADDTDAELGAEGVPLDGDDAGDVYVTVCEEVKDTVPATLRAEAGDGAEASEHATAVEAGDWVEFIAAADAEEDAAREEVPPAEERRAAIKATAAPLRRPPEEGFQCGTACACNTLATHLHTVHALHALSTSSTHRSDVRRRPVVSTWKSWGPCGAGGGGGFGCL